ncbi:hypothetical protein [Pseudomonas farris]
MNKQPVNTKTNVVANGHFEDYSHWEDVGAPGGNIVLKHGEWEGADIAYMSLYKGSGVGQELPAPGQLSAVAKYRLSFLYDNRSAGDGLFILRNARTEEKLEIPLPSSGNDPEVLALNLTLKTVLIGFDIQKGDVLDVEVTSPTGATALNDVIIARIDLHYELSPLILVHIINDGQVFIPAERPLLYLCYGATGEASHQLSFEPEPGNAWTDTEGLLWRLDNPLDGVVVTPRWDENQLIEKPWQVDCPEPIRDDVQLFELCIYSKYHADPYSIAVSLGHHRLLVNSFLEPAYQPVIEYQQSVKLGVQVLSYYLHTPIRNQEVCWLSGEEVLDRVSTDEGGYAWFDYCPDVDGLHTISASVQSLFYAQGSAVQSFEVRVHATDPLKVVQIRFPDMEPALWGEKNGYPDRGATYPLTVLFSANSPLRNLSVWLAWEGEPAEELGVAVSPALLEPVPVTGTQLVWQLNCQDIKDSMFGLQLRCAELLEPTVINHMMLARHSLKIGDVRDANRTPVVDEGDYVWCMLQVLSLGDEPVSGVAVEWDTPQGIQRTYTGVNGWASVIDRPAVHGNYDITGRVQVRGGEKELTHTFPVKTVQTSAWKTASFTLDGVAVDRVNAGVVLNELGSQKLHLDVKPDSPLIGKTVSLRWRNPASKDSILIREMNWPVPITSAGVDWYVLLLIGAPNAVHDLQVVSAGLEDLDLAFRLFSTILSEELTLVFDRKPKNWDTAVDLYPCIGATHELTILPQDDLGPLHGLMLETTVEPSLPSGWNITPSLAEPSPMTAGGVRFDCDMSGTTEGAELRWNAKVLIDDGLVAQPSALRLKLAHNKVVLGTTFEVATDPVLSKGESARLAVQYLSAFTGKPASNVPVEWDDVEQMSFMTGPDGIVQRDYQPASSGAHHIQALIHNLYDSTQIAHSLEVYAHQNDPWLDLHVRQGSGSARPWGGQTFFPRRDERLELILSAPQDNPLHNQRLTLGLTGLDQLDPQLSFGPEGLGVPRELPADGLPIRLLAGDQTDAAFSLQLSATRLLERSPPNAFSLGRNEQAIIVAGMSGERKVVGWGETLSFEIALISPLSGQSAKNIQVEWEGVDRALEHVITRTDFYGRTTISFVATIPGAGRLSARIVGGSDVFEFEYFVHEAGLIQALTSPLLENYPGEEVSAEATVVSASTGEPLEGVKVHWFFKDVPLEPAVTDAQGKARIVFTLPWGLGALSASVRGESGRESARLVFTMAEGAETWLREFTPYINGERVEWPDLTLGLVAGNSCTLTLDYENSLLIGDPLALLALEYRAGAEGQGLVFDPPLGQLRAMAEGTTSLSWSITTDQALSGRFVLHFGIPLIEKLPTSPPLRGEIVNLAQEVEVKFDEFPVTFGASAAYPCRGATHAFTLRAKPSSQLLNKAIKLVWGGEPSEDLGVVVTPALENEQLLTLEGVRWELNCLDTESGDFSLQLMLVETGRVSSPLAMALGHNLVTAERWSKEVLPGGPMDPYTQYFIRATSSFLNLPAPGIRVTVNFDDGGSTYEVTNSDGEAVWNDYLRTFKAFEITNQYDGSIV